MEDLCKIRNLQRVIIQFEYSFIQRFGLTLNEGMLLCTLLEHDYLIAGHLAEALGLTPSNTSKVICLVEKKQLITRIPNKEDKRQMLFSLTAKGKQLITQIKESSFDLPDKLRKAIEYADVQT